MTGAQAAWLRTLLDEGPQSVSVLFNDHPQAVGCLGNDWTEWTGDPNDPERITPAGLAALAEHDRSLQAQNKAEG